MVLAIFIAEILRLNKKKQSGNAIIDFKDLLGSRDKLVEELEQMAPNHSQPE